MVTMASSATGSIATTSISADVTTTTTVQKKSSENRRSNKPIMEKRRRARINNSLNELKALILDAMKKDPARHSKLEKADILEMTVKHLESLHKQQAAMSVVTDPHVINKYRAGFSECAGEVKNFPGLEETVRTRLLQHLSNCLNSAALVAIPNNNNNNNNEVPNRVSQQNLQVHILPSDNTTISSQNGIILSAGANTGVQFVPTRLPNGDFALVLPSTSNCNIQRRHSISPTPSSSSSSPPPLAMINHSRSASTDSAASSNSPIAFERLSVNITPSNSSIEDMCHSPNSINSNYSSPYSPGVSTTNSNYDNFRLYSPPSQKPLSLVVRETYIDVSSEEKPWRPW